MRKRSPLQTTLPRRCRQSRRSPRRPACVPATAAVAHAPCCMIAAAPPMIAFICLRCPLAERSSRGRRRASAPRTFRTCVSPLAHRASRLVAPPAVAMSDQKKPPPIPAKPVRHTIQTTPVDPPPAAAAAPAPPSKIEADAPPPPPQRQASDVLIVRERAEDRPLPPPPPGDEPPAPVAPQPKKCAISIYVAPQSSSFSRSVGQLLRVPSCLSPHLCPLDALCTNRMANSSSKAAPAQGAAALVTRGGAAGAVTGTHADR